VAVTSIAHKPDLTAQQTKEIFSRHFGAKYKVEDWKGPSVGFSRDFVVVKNPFVGVAIKLEQAQDTTKFVYAGLCPRVWARLLLGGLVGFLFWAGITNEMKEFMETAPEFR
jgi:hypothetical protein